MLKIDLEHMDFRRHIFSLSASVHFIHHTNKPYFFLVISGILSDYRILIQFLRRKRQIVQYLIENKWHMKKEAVKFHNDTI